MPTATEQVRVAAIFAPGQGVKPVWFEWRREKHAVRELSYVWQDQVGNAPRLHFAVSDGNNLFELIYHVRDQNWTLGGIDGD
ncbi:hypothetical protein [Geomesophilobacter sediminis]|uniref:Uncharacterized protein n=1 Tax=Geomesophilobacter sediminis TaxID=2798584 RepID=A0A8J7LWT0_9BACT|nr:hypothetical protein [Geomesophilobacter sediminis]MBJ6726205.1 hypothetical protein [Geomesophilobacter sediminis]